MNVQSTLFTVGGAALVLALVYFVVSTLLKQSCPKGCPPCGKSNPCRKGEKCIDGKCIIVKEAPGCVYKPENYQACVAYTDKDFKSGKAKPGAIDEQGQKITDWSECSKTCGGGLQFRYKGVAVKREPLGKPCDAWCAVGTDKNDCLYERRSCNQQACETKKQVDEDKYVAVQNQVKSLEAKLNKYKSNFDNQQAKIDAAKKDMAKLQKQLKAQEALKKQLEAANSQNKSLTAEKAANDKKMKEIQAQIAKDKINIDKLQKEKKASTQQIANISDKLNKSEEKANKLQKTITCEVDSLYNCASRTCLFTKVSSDDVCKTLKKDTKGDQMRYHSDTKNCYVDGYVAWASKTQEDGINICLTKSNDKRFVAAKNLFTKLPENQHPETCKNTKTRICRPVDCAYTATGNYTSCSRSCNGGIQTRNRSIKKTHHKMVERHA